MLKDKPEEIVEDIAKRIAALRGRWEQSGHTDLSALSGAMMFYAPILPGWLSAGLREVLRKLLPQMRRPYHEVRWLTVREALTEGYEWVDAYAVASKRLKGTPARGKSDAMMKSYQKVERGLPAHARRPRTYRKRPPPE
jgi:hypothetical protein